VNQLSHTKIDVLQKIDYNLVSDFVWMCKLFRAGQY